MERFDEREQSITRNVIWIVMPKKKMRKVTGIKRGKKETGIENNLLARKNLLGRIINWMFLFVISIH